MKPRLYWLLALLALWIGAIAVRLYHLQVNRHDEFARRAERQQQRVIELDPPRGTIYDARGRELAVSVEVESAFAVPREVPDARAAAKALARALDVDGVKLERLLGADREFVWVARKLDPPQARRVKELRLPGIYFLEESKRYYPLREVGAHALGYVGTDNHGLAGLEAMYDKVVAGKPGRRTVLRDARQGMAVPANLPSAAPVPGSDLYLTLDAALQQIAERELAKAAERHRPQSGSVVLLEPSTGAVLALASWPTFDSNRFATASDAQRRNRPVSDAYEPGSTFKMVTAAAALEEGLIDPDETLDCEMGGITLAGVRISDHKPFGMLSFRDVIAKSSNVGTIKTSLRLSNASFYAMIRAFGFGRTSGIDLPGESPGLLMPVARWPGLAKAYIAFGQGISITPLQLALAFGTIANGGRLLEPYLVRQTGSGVTAKTQHAEAVERGRPISPATLAVVADLLAGVTAEGGTGRSAVVSGYPVAGKTGTAQKAEPGRGYLANEFIASFAGYAPTAHPAIVAVVVIDDPQGGYHGGDVAAPVFAAIAQQALLYLNVRPERERPERWPGEPAPPTETEPGKPENSRPQPDPEQGIVTASLEAGDPAPTVLPAGSLPDLAGMTARQALAATADLRLYPILRGAGVVQRQEPPPGSPMPPPGTRVELYLASGAGG
ncbi:MAG: penicillin-binding protein 2 [Thermoanaerobaculia bacterium]|nr:penicillin-binding protein 2 [Thermoanaerobaculia bacterium]